MTSAKILGFVLRSSDRSATAAFYELIGLKAHEHQHSGPLHFEIAAVSDEAVLEIYSASQKHFRDSVMVECADLAGTLRRLAERNIFPDRIIEQNLMVYVRDPDGRDVLLIQEDNIV